MESRNQLKRDNKRNKGQAGGQGSRQSKEQVSKQSKEQVSGQVSKQSKGQVSGRENKQNKGQVSGQGIKQSKEQVSGKVSKQSKEQVSGRENKQNKGQVSGQGSKQNEGHAGGKESKSKEQVSSQDSKQSKGRVSSQVDKQNKEQISGQGSKQYAGKRYNQGRRLDKGQEGTASNGALNPSLSKSRARDICPVSSSCGGCKWIGRSYEEQLQEKNKRLRMLMEPYCRPEKIIAMDHPTHYRNKVHAVFGEDRKHNIISGIYEEKSHRIVPVDSCYIENQKADEIIVSVRELLRSFKIRPYNEDTGYGLLRHVLIRTGHVTGQIMVVLVISSPIMPSKNNFVKALLKLHPEITTIVVNVNERNTSMILGDKEQVLYGKGYIEDELCGKTFRISPKSFYQVNSVQTEKLYEKALEYAGLTGQETVLDAYCGTGTIGIIASERAAKVIGVELNRDAVRDAVSNARRNNISNISFYQNDAGKFLMGMAERHEKLDVLFMDPPRSGSDEAFLSSVAAIAPGRVVYISCNPDTLVRDLKFLQKKGYRAERCVGVDMFPFTEHVETVVLLSHKKTTA